MSPYLSLLRPKQWIKNVIILFPIFFSGVMLDEEGKIFPTCAVLILFCMFCSGTYILNDIHDKKTDAVHPEKKKRPIASGKIQPKDAFVISIILLLISLCGALYINRLCGELFLLYLINTMLYTYLLKSQIIIDVFLISFGFVIRGFIGATVSGVMLSPWFVVIIFFGSLFLGFSKRYQEVMLYNSRRIFSRKIISQYNEEFLKQAITLLTSVLVLAYALYTFQSVQSEHMIWTLPFFVFLVLRYYYHIFFYKNSTGSIENILIYDKYIIGASILYIIAVFILIYF